MPCPDVIQPATDDPEALRHVGACIVAAPVHAVGLGSIWKFPYMVGVYGGGAFVLVFSG